MFVFTLAGVRAGVRDDQVLLPGHLEEVDADRVPAGRQGGMVPLISA